MELTNITSHLTKDSISEVPEVIRSLGTAAWKRCETIAMYSETPDCVTRTFLSPPMKQVHATVREWMVDAGLDVRIDGIGNIIGRREPKNPEDPIYAIGSHLDSVPNAGIYDGVLGVTAGIAVAKLLHDDDLPFGLEIVGFSEEEGVRFGYPFLGSHGYSGSFEPEMLYLKDRGGKTVEDACQEFGLNPRDLIRGRSAPDNLAGYFELHIEQGFALEHADLPVGYVTTIAGQQRLRCRVTGRSQHAGSTPMNIRHDALQASCEMIALTERIAGEFGDLVMTTGQIHCSPNASNCIPGEIVFSIDTRHHSDAIMERAVMTWRQQCEKVAEERGVKFEVISHQHQKPVDLDSRLQETIKNSATEKVLPIVSWAGHDALIMADAVPCSMIMLQTKDGLSHHPDEFTECENAVRGVHLLYQSIRALASSSNILR